jgi:Tfp pilus assembly protein PilF
VLARQLEFIEDRFRALPADPGPPLPVPEAQAALDDLDYLRVAELLIGHKQERELLDLLEREAPISWLTGRLLQMAYEPKLVQALTAAARVRLQEDPKALAAPTRTLLASLARHSGDRKTAVEFDPEVLKSPPDEVTIRQTAGRLDQAGRHKEAALVWLQQHVPEDGSVKISLLWLSCAERRFGKALEGVQMLLADAQLKPEQANELRYMRANVLMELGKLAEAEAAVQSVLEAAPGNPAALNLLAYLYLDQDKQLDQAEALLRQALKAQPKNASLRATLGWALARRKQTDEGLKMMEEVASDEQLAVDPAFLEHLGDVYRQAGRLDKARESWQKALAAFPRTTDAGDRRKVAIEQKLREAKE